jgi:hypothetical protein
MWMVTSVAHFYFHRGFFYMPPLTQEMLKEILQYDEETGLFTWRTSKARIVYPGRPAGCMNNFGYMRIGINRKSYLAHNLAWLYHYGRWPTADIDHINCKKADNRISNLREATRSQNTLNTKTHRNQTSGVRGVDWVKNRQKWMVRIQIEGVRKTIGLFPTLEDAIKARQEAEKLIFPN